MDRQPAFMTLRGVIRCAYCRTDEYGLPPGEGRISDGHVGVRFDDHARGPWVIRLEGEDVTDRCVEAVAGSDGRVYLYDLDLRGHRYLCPSGEGHAVAVVYRGRVQVVRDPGASAAAS